jgi:hypothetical protein
MAKRFDEHHDENSREMDTIKQHLDKQDKQIESMGKKLDEVLILLGGSIIGKTKGLVEVVDELAISLEDWSTKFIHAEKWRVKFVEGEQERRNMVEKKKQVEEDREYQAKLKDKEIAALKNSNRIKNWVAAAAVVASIFKFIYDHYASK